MRIFLFIIANLLFLPNMAFANISLDKVIIGFSPNQRPVENITVTNQSENVLKVTGTAFKITDSGQDTETEEPAKGLVIAPKSFEIKPGESRVVRLVLREFPDDLEGIYRVRFKPDQANYNEQTFEGGKSVRIGVVLTMGALVTVAPKNPAPDLSFQRTGNTVTFENKGNVTAQLQREDFCNESRTECIPLQGKRIYPGMTWTLEVPEKLTDKAFTQTLLMNGQYSTLSFPAP